MERDASYICLEEIVDHCDTAAEIVAPNIRAETCVCHFVQPHLIFNNAPCYTTSASLGDVFPSINH